MRDHPLDRSLSAQGCMSYGSGRPATRPRVGREAPQGWSHNASGMRKDASSARSAASGAVLPA
ncbi:hypothetical protein GCM10010317_070180 [Streptomyces mirabilis]|nr:hypothetical protein GCM10010317_070180 [Streptomyces mirabilis]